MQVHTFTAHGRGHSILAALSTGPKYRSELIFDHKAGYVLHALMRVGFIKPGAGRYLITPDGEAALRGLEAGENVTATEGGSIRVFTDPQQEAA